MGALSCDAWGDALMKLLSDMGVGRAGVQRRLKAPTRQVYIAKDARGDYTFEGFSEDDPAAFADAHLFADSIPSACFVVADFLILGTLSLAYADTRQSVRHSVGLARSHQVPILVDVNWQAMFWPQPREAPGYIYDLLKAVQFLKVSAREADWLFGTRSPAAIACQFPHLKGVLMLTEGKGCHYEFRGIGGYVPEFEVDIEEMTGANDAFVAGFVHQLMNRGLSCLSDAQSVNDIVVYASAVSALTKTRPGAIAAFPTPKEVEVFLYLNSQPL